MIDTDKYEGHTPAPWELMRSGPLRDDAPKDLDNWWVKLNEARAKTSGGEWMRNIGNAYMTEADAQLIADAPLLLEEVKRLRKGIKELAERWTNSTVAKPSTLLVLAVNELKELIE